MNEFSLKLERLSWRSQTVQYKSAVPPVRVERTRFCSVLRSCLTLLTILKSGKCLILTTHIMFFLHVDVYRDYRSEIIVRCAVSKE